jgi:hypothetical protein
MEEYLSIRRRKRENDREADNKPRRKEEEDFVC